MFSPVKILLFLKKFTYRTFLTAVIAADIAGMSSLLLICIRPDIHRNLVSVFRDLSGFAGLPFPERHDPPPPSPAADSVSGSRETPSFHRLADPGQQYFPFEKSKRELIKIYREAPVPETFYCRCPLIFRNGKIYPDIAACGYKIRKQEKRARRIEWEHIVPASWFGGQMECWKQGGRNNCNNVPEFEIMAGDMHNLTPAVGEVNDDRKAYRYRQFPHPDQSVYGNCRFFISEDKPRAAEPPEYTRGFIARAFKYMARQHGLKFSKGDRQFMEIWDKKYPPDAWECQRNQLIKQVQGNDNPFVTEKCSLK